MNTKNMKINYRILLSFVLALSVFSCSEDDLDINALTDFAPGILEITPGDGNKVVKGDFDIVAKFVDGTVSPLAEGTLKLMDIDGNEIASVSQALNGTADSVMLAASDFNAAELELGLYQLEATATDVKGQITTYAGTFEISSLPFAANYEEMYLAGPYNSWGADAFELTGPNTWTLKEVMLDGGEWKLKNCADWCDQDWADPDGDGLVENTTGGGPNSASSPAGLYNVIFNDQALTIVFEPAITFEQNVGSLFLVGSFNDFQGTPEYEFSQVEDNIWKIAEVELNAGDLFKFSEGANFSGINYGDNEPDGIADEFGSPITFAEANNGFYEVTFNDKSLEYQFVFLRFPSIGIIGSATPGGWDSDTDLIDNGDGTFSVTLDLVDGEAKFRANDDWGVNWGAADFPSGVATQDGANIPVTAGTYKVTFNPSTGDYSFEPATVNIGIIGSATPGGWDADTDMTKNEDGSFSVLIALTDGEAKFRENDDWAVNWGGGASFPTGTATLNGDNIPVTAGIYIVTFNPTTGEYSFDAASIGIIGSATPGGWDADTDLEIADVANPAVVSATITLTDGEAKFRVNDDWAINWGAADFPSGTGVRNGDNIPVTAGTYVVTLNVNTAEYSFDLQ